MPFPQPSTRNHPEWLRVFPCSPARITVKPPSRVCCRGMKTTLRFVAMFCGLGSAILNFCRAEDVKRNPQTVYFTVGDAQDLLYTPLESKASIEAVFDVLHERYHTARVWWRGGQDEVWGNQFVLREQNRYYWRVWEWWRDLQYRVVKCNQLAVKAAHARGMELWMAYGLFDNGSGPDVGFTGFPYAAER